jgi:hypothetical protein
LTKNKAARYRVIWSPTPIPNFKTNEGDWFIGDNISLQQCTLNNAGNINFKGGWYSGSSNTKKSLLQQILIDTWKI